MSEPRPLVSVVLPFYNGARFLGDALASVGRQGLRSYEVVAVDDGSTDGGAEIARRAGPRVRCFRRDNGGPARARNAALERARGELVAFLDADDLWPDGALAAHLDFLRANEDVEGTIGRVQLEELRSGRFEPVGEPVHAVNLGAAVYRRSVFEKVGVFDPALRLSEDVDFFLRLREKGVRPAFLDAITLRYRWHGGNMTRGMDQKTLVRALKMSLDRRRGSASPASSLAGPER